MSARLVFFIAIFLSGCAAGEKPSRELEPLAEGERSVSWDLVEESGTTLNVRAGIFRDCEDFDRVDVLEDPESVTVRVVTDERPPPSPLPGSPITKSCTLAGLDVDAEVTLEEPLGDRELKHAPVGELWAE